MNGWFVRNDYELECLVKYLKGRLAEGKGTTLEVQESADPRTFKQNSALHVGCKLLADELNEAGFDMRRFPFKEGVDIPWDTDLVKEHLFKPIMKAQTGKASTRKLTKQEVSAVWQTLTRHLAQVTGVSAAFPSWEAHYEAQASKNGSKGRMARV